MKWIFWQAFNPIIVIAVVIITPLGALWDFEFKERYRQAWAFIDDIYENNWLDA